MNQPHQTPNYPPYQAQPVTYQAPSPYDFQHSYPKAPHRPQYVRTQNGHSIIKALLLDWITMYTRSIYWTISPNHYWHA